ncbi:hypothetical protein [Actinoplanes sp. HUAS TT8]|uniref:hypothetical protein n=1 Tax=Actinoplanes sp. HUAS TT8 TaxID=3447453 RepID=UPI003F522ADF
MGRFSDWLGDEIVPDFGDGHSAMDVEADACPDCDGTNRHDRGCPSNNLPIAEASARRKKSWLDDLLD